MHWKKPQKAYARFIRSYLLAIVFPILIGCVVAGVAISAAQADRRHYALNELDGYVKVVDGRISSAIGTAQYLAGSARTRRIVLADDRREPEFVAGTIDYVGYLSALWNTGSSGLQRMYVYLHRSRKVISPYTVYDAEDFYPAFFSCNDWTAEEYYRFLMEQRPGVTLTPNAQVTLADVASEAGTSETILLCAPVRVGTSVAPLGAVVLLLDQAQVNDELGSLLLDSGGVSAIVTAEGGIVAQSGADERLALLGQVRLEDDGLTVIGDSLIVCKRSQQTDWFVVTISDEMVYMASVYRLAGLLVGLLAAALLAGGIVAYLLALGSSGPLRRMAALLGVAPEAGERTIYGELETGIQSLLANNRDLRESHERLRRELPAVFFNRLYSRSFAGGEDIGRIGREMQVEVPPGRHVVVIVRVNESTGSPAQGFIHLGLTKARIIAALEEETNEKPLIYHSSETEMAWLYTTAAEEMDEALEPTLAALRRRLMDEGIACLLSVGTPFTDLYDAYLSFGNAVQFANRGSLSGDIPVLWYWSIGETNVAHADDERSIASKSGLADAVLNGEVELVRGFARSARQRYGGGAARERADVTALLESVVETARAALEMPPQDAAAAMDAADEATRFEAALQDLLACSTHALERSNASAQTLAGQIKAFVDEQFASPEMGLKMVSSHVNITETYLSRIFKESTGENFVGYVEKRRIRKAKELLTASKASIAEVSAAVGYTSDNVFRRAFKRAAGVTPAEYRRKSGRQA